MPPFYPGTSYLHRLYLLTDYLYHQYIYHFPLFLVDELA